MEVRLDDVVPGLTAASGYSPALEKVVVDLARPPAFSAFAPFDKQGISYPALLENH